MSHWLYKGEILSEPPEGAAGFIYCITNTVNNRKYIGRKYFTRTKRKKVKDNIRRRVVTKSSDWRSYTGSNKTLSADIKELGKANFVFEILVFGYSKGQVNYLEENVQHKYDALTSPDYYNDSIGSRKYINIQTDHLLRDAINWINATFQ